MLRNILAAIMVSAFAVTLTSAQPPSSVQEAPGAGAARQGGGGRGGGNSHYPTAEQWAAMPATAGAYVEKAKALAGTDPDLQFDFGIFCAAGGGASNPERASIGVPNSEPRL